MKNNKHKNQGFTLIELLVVIAIIGILSSIVIASLNDAKRKAQTASHVSQVKQIQTQLDLYFDKYGQYPNSDYDGCGGWDTGNKDFPLLGGSLDGWNTPVINSEAGNCSGIRYYRYSPGDYGCPIVKGYYYVLGFTTSSNLPVTTSPGWSCPTRDWQGEFQYVVGRFENDF